MSLDAVGVQEPGNAVVPLLTFGNNGSSDETASGETASDSETATTRSTAMAERHSADEPAAIPDDLLIRSPSELDGTVAQVASDTPQSAFDTAVSTSSSETTDAVYFWLPANVTTANDSVETTAAIPVTGEDTGNTSRVTNTTRKWVCWFVMI